MRPKAIFIAPRVDEAVYWINQWGYQPPEVKIVTRVEQLHGWRPDSLPVYVCGSVPPEDPMIDYLIAVGFDLIDAQDLSEPPSGTWWFPDPAN